MLRLLINNGARGTLLIGILMLLPALCDAYAHSANFSIFMRTSLIIISVSVLILVATHGQSWKFSTRFGFLLTLVLWLLGVFLGSIPIYFSHLHISYAAALYEATSALTDTGGTALKGLDHMPPGILLWRSLLSWVGGLGVIALTLLLMPNLRSDSVQFYNMEYTEKILPRVSHIIRAIVSIYLGLSFLCMVAFYMSGMSLFDSINNAMSTIATSGVSTHDSSFAFYNSNTILFICGFFMILGSLPMTFYLKLVTIGYAKSIKDTEVLTFLTIVAISILLIFLYLFFHNHISAKNAFFSAYFQFTSIISTAGFNNQDYSKWGNFPVMILLVATFLGGCAGSTSGGLKINRAIMAWKITRSYLNKLISPHTISKCRYSGKEMSDDLKISVMMFVFLYLFTIFVGTLALFTTGLDLTSAFSGSLTSLSNMGLGLGNKIGPSGNYSLLSDIQLWIMSIIMLAGRLEILSLILVFSPDFWKH